MKQAAQRDTRIYSLGDTWKTIVKSPKQTKGKFKINITFGQSTEMYERQSSPEI